MRSVIAAVHIRRVRAIAGRLSGIKTGPGSSSKRKARTFKTMKPAAPSYIAASSGLRSSTRLLPNAAWYCWHASKRQAMVEAVWQEFGAFVHQQIIWVKSRPVLTYSTYLWRHEPCLFGWVRGQSPKTLRAEVGQLAGAFPSTVWEVPSSEVDTNAHPTCKPCRLFTLPHGDAYRNW